MDIRAAAGAKGSGLLLSPRRGRRSPLIGKPVNPKPIKLGLFNLVKARMAPEAETRFPLLPASTPQERTSLSGFLEPS